MGSSHNVIFSVGLLLSWTITFNIVAQGDQFLRRAERTAGRVERTNACREGQSLATGDVRVLAGVSNRCCAT